ncbi:glycosyltransferase [Pandoraea cepalis]|uniref:Glycosyl transferase family 1 n=1 Tax=Pandoraea cepalis TaxID=2508294 RepID=A0A5E4XFL0_9BURK|nr:glycosyltransferase [Pandoraea cepalis]VVE35117.1 glycosyl transferase family 1 [Pandoraea cepalis]
MKICFFSHMTDHSNWREAFEKVEFYRVDIEILRSLGHEVVLAGDFKTFDRTADLYYCWWWTYAMFPVVQSLIGRKPVVVTGAFDYDTCHGVIPGLSYLDRPTWQRALMAAALRTASANLFISQCEYEKVTSNLVVRNAVNCPLAINTEHYRLANPALAREDFFFTVSWSSKTNVQRKCLESIIKAFGEYAKTNAKTRLVMAGKKGDYYENLVELAKSCGVAERVEFPGMISDEEKIRKYQACIAYVQPTLFEGFGLAIGEALACGAQVITSPSGAVPEVAVDFAQYVEPNNVEALTTAMRKAVDEILTMDRKIAQFEHINRTFSIEARREHLGEIIDRVASRKVTHAQRYQQ